MKISIKPLSIFIALFSFGLALSQGTSNNSEKKPTIVPATQPAAKKPVVKDSKDSARAERKAIKQAKADSLRAKIEADENKRQEINRSDLASRAAVKNDARKKRKMPMPVKP